MKLYAVQMLFKHVDDTITIFSSKKKAIEFLNNEWKKFPTSDFMLKEFELSKGKSYERIIELPF